MIKLGVKEALLGAALALLPEAAEAKKPRLSDEKQIAALCAEVGERVFSELFWANDFETKGTRARVARVADAEEAACKIRLREQKKEKHGPIFRGRGMEIEL